MGRRGRKRQLLVEAEYWRLLQSGVGTVMGAASLALLMRSISAGTGLTGDFLGASSMIRR